MSKKTQAWLKKQKQKTEERNDMNVLLKNLSKQEADKLLSQFPRKVDKS